MILEQINNPDGTTTNTTTKLNALAAEKTHRNLTRITLFSVNEIQQTYRDYIDFKSHIEVDNYLANKTRIPYLDIFSSHQSEDQPIRYAALLENIQTFNYVRIENYFNLGADASTLFYGKINDFKYLNDGTTLINFTKDVFTTWLPNVNLIPIGSVPVERGHINDIQNDGVSLFQQNINAEEIAATTSLQTSLIDTVNFNYKDASKNVSWAVWQVMKNWGNDSPASPFDGQTPTQLSAPNILYYLIIPFNPITQQTYAFSCSGVDIPAQGSLNDVAITIGEDGQLVSSMQFVGGYSSEDLGFNFVQNGNQISVPDQTLVGHGFTATGPSGSFSLFRVSSMVSVLKTWDTGVSPYALVRSTQDKILQQASSNYTIRNVKTSQEPFARIDLSDGFGGFASYNPSLINFQSTNETLKFKRMGSLGLSNKLFTGVHKYRALQLNLDENSPQYRNQLFQNGIFQTEGREIPIISDTFTSTNALNQNRNAMVQTNAQLSVTNNTIANNNAKRNNQAAIQATNAQLKNTQLNEKAQRDIRTGANIVSGVGDMFGANLSSDQANLIAGGIGGGVGGAANGIGGGAIGVGGSAISGLARGLVNGAQSNNAINQNQSTQLANQAIANKLSTQTTDNNIQASGKIAANNYENTIANFNASQSDLKNAPDTVIQQAGNVYFTFQTLNYLTMYSVMTEPADRIIQTDMYFTMFGYAQNEWRTPQGFMSLINSRSRFNYIRVAAIKFNTRNPHLNIPIKDIEQIESAFIAGITIWHDYSQIFDYYPENRQLTVNYAPTADSSNNLQIQNLLANMIDYQRLMKEPAPIGKYSSDVL